MAKTLRSADFRLTARQILQAKNRPQTEPWEDRVTVGLAVATLFAVFWDGWLHNNSTTLDSFWSDAHIAMYAGLTTLGAWIGVVFVKRQPRGKGTKLNLSMEAVPYGYGLALVALPLAALGGPGDFAWHAAYGFENQIDAPFSPTHQMLFLAGGLLGGIGLASTWHRPGRVLPLSQLWPAVLSATAVLAMVSFTFMNLLPWFWTMVPTGAFQDNLLTFKDAYAPGSGDSVKHVEGLYNASINYSGDVFPYYLFGNMASIGGVLIWTAAFVATVLYVRRRWVLPFGAVTLMCTLLSVLFPFFTRFTNLEFIPTLIIVGLLVDIAARVLIVEDPASRVRIRGFALLVPLLVWGPWELAVALFGDGGLGWHPTMWTGVLTTSMGVGYGISLIMFPPALPAVEDAEAEVA
ncbi:hypothetical protein OM076_19135 [Solirubrobacter ginsenosidimutans]|uniref:Uncharacterized protein n=1 Tax=Solirubrobacter ginsenosidimutans TaxID=490573 RepID=A0A9X3MW98_9ACTN|nr:hypothetical protein [Solirubrobacter ginsenosidimutans]MDA0162395.1 hypothetical protein [Solirubrobacter ginsenosidimutans]